LFGDANATIERCDIGGKREKKLTSAQKYTDQTGNRWWSSNMMELYDVEQKWALA
jgi:hypothetical protein